MNIYKLILVFVLVCVTLSCVNKKDVLESKLFDVDKKKLRGVYVDLYTQEKYSPEEMKKYTRIGLLISTNRHEVPMECNLGTIYGVLVNSVFEGTPAAAAGLKRNDLLTSINGIRVENPIKYKKNMKKIMDHNERVVYEAYRGCTLIEIYINNY